MLPLTSLPMSLPFVQPTAEQMVEMQRVALQNQKLQLTQLQQMVAQYAKSIETALGQIQEALDKAPAEGEKSDVAARAAVLNQVLAQNQAQNQALSQAQQLRARFDPRRADFRQDWQLQDCQAWYQGGLGDFGRPVF